MFVVILAEDLNMDLKMRALLFYKSFLNHLYFFFKSTFYLQLMSFLGFDCCRKTLV